MLDRSQTHRVQTQHVYQTQKAPTGYYKKLNVSKLKSHEAAALLAEKLGAKNADFSPSDDPKTDWETFAECLYKTSYETLGPKSSKHQDWFDENDAEIKTLLEKKQHIYKAFLDDPSSICKKKAFANIRSTIQKKLRQMQNHWLAMKAESCASTIGRNHTRLVAIIASDGRISHCAKLQNSLRRCVKRCRKVELNSTFRNGFCNLSRDIFGRCKVC